MFASTISFYNAQAQVNVVFDLGGVFMDKSFKRIFNYVGFGRLANLVFRGKDIKKTLFSLLDAISLSGELADIDRATCDDHGRPCPNALLHWMKGNASGREIIDAVEYYYENESTCGKTEKKAMTRIVRTIFDPDMFIEMTNIYQKALDFLQECIDEGHNIYILSNLDMESYEALSCMLPGFFELFDGVVISADVNVMKPNPEIYTYLLDTYNLNPEETVFIDDQQENLTVAQELGIFPIKCCKTGWFGKKPNFNKVRKSFAHWKLEREEQLIQ